MTQGKQLAAMEKNIIVKDIANVITQEAVSRKLDRNVSTVQLYLENPAPRKTQSDKGVSKTVTARFTQVA